MLYISTYLLYFIIYFFLYFSWSLSLTRHGGPLAINSGRFAHVFFYNCTQINVFFLQLVGQDLYPTWGCSFPCMSLSKTTGTKLLLFSYSDKDQPSPIPFLQLLGRYTHSSSLALFSTSGTSLWGPTEIDTGSRRDRQTHTHRDRQTEKTRRPRNKQPKQAAVSLRPQHTPSHEFPASTAAKHRTWRTAETN